MSAAPRTLADTGVSGVIWTEEQRKRDVATALVDQAESMLAEAFYAARRTAGHIVENLPAADRRLAGLRVAHLASEMRVLADALDAAAKSPAPALHEAA